MSKKWWKAAGIRAAKTIAQTAATLIGGNVVNVFDIDWLTVLGVAATAGILSILTSVAGLPEVDER